MIAIEVFLGLTVLGLIAVFVLQLIVNRQDDHGHKGDAEKTEEEIRSHERKS